MPRDEEDKAPARLTVTMQTLRLRARPVWKGSPVQVAVDGSAPSDCPEGGVSACAAASTTGHLLIGWYEHPALTSPSAFAEFQALRLGYRLAVRIGARAGAPVTLIADHEHVADAIRQVARGHALPWPVIGAIDDEAISEIRFLAAQGVVSGIAVQHKTSVRQLSHTGVTALARRAHAAAWLARRLAAAGISPAAEAEWLAQVTALELKQKTSLHKACMKRLAAIREAPADNEEPEAAEGEEGT